MACVEMIGDLDTILNLRGVIVKHFCMSCWNISILGGEGTDFQLNEM